MPVNSKLYVGSDLENIIRHGPFTRCAKHHCRLRSAQLAPRGKRSGVAEPPERHVSLVLGHGEPVQASAVCHWCKLSEVLSDTHARPRPTTLSLLNRTAPRRTKRGVPEKSDSQKPCTPHIRSLSSRRKTLQCTRHASGTRESRCRAEGRTPRPCLAPHPSTSSGLRHLEAWRRCTGTQMSRPGRVRVVPSEPILRRLLERFSPCQGRIRQVREELGMIVFGGVHREEWRNDERRWQYL